MVASEKLLRKEGNVTKANIQEYTRVVRWQYLQGTGKGTNALIVTIVRTLILGTPLSAIFALSFNWGLAGVWWGLVVGNLLGSFLACSWAIIYILGLK